LVQALSLAGASTPITVKIEGEPGTHLAFAREIQWDPRRDTLVHVDLLAADVARLSVAQVNVVLFGESPGARISAGNVVQLTRTVEVQALPLEMPAQLEVDLGQLTEPDGLIRVGDIQLSPSVTVLTDAEEIVARIEIPRGGEFEAETPDGGPGAGAAAPGE
jgi:large subunit ribosomal protein L25